ncbi:MAG TPA: MBL fold metallo-hydrolase [Phycisphaerae bacterium]|nr:MBL fold metallo-hydrolase [Phycisphaerae bacterium]
MALELCVLGSGSSGNCTVVRGPWGSFLIDAGFGPRTTAQRLSGTGVELAHVQAILLTHLDTDHFNPNWFQTLLKQGIHLFAAANNARHLARSREALYAQEQLRAKHLLRHRLEELIHAFPEEGAFEVIPGIQVDAIHLAHDAAGSHGFLLCCDAYRVGFATDLGHVPEELIARFCGVDVLALEANYDPEMQRSSDRPWFLKQRIMGGRGHLSNEQALAAIQSVLDQTAARCGPDRLPRHIVLLHRSRQCNCPGLLRKLFMGDPRIAQVLTLTDQHERTGWLNARRPRAQVFEQLALAWN